jgi:hypothetical protein
MKRRFLAFSVAILGMVLGATAQEDDTAIRAKTTVHGDGTRTEMITNPVDKTMRATTYDAADKVIGKVLNRLNDDLEPIEAFAYDPNGKPLYRTEFKRDFNGRVTEMIDYTTENKLIRRLVYSYDSVGKVTGIKAYDANGREIPSQKRQK